MSDIIHIRKPAYRSILDQPRYKTNCMLGESHPLGLETVEQECYSYELIVIGEIDESEVYSNYQSADIGSLLEAYIKDPKIEWALENSFDGLYVEAVPDPSTFATHYKLGAYLRKEHITFWRLKYSGT